MSLKDLVRAIACELVDAPEEVVVTELGSDGSSVIELRVAKSDIGKVIGKDGRTAQSIRTLLAAAKPGKRAHLEILD